MASGSATLQSLPPRAAAADASGALTTRALDFWLLGGASLVVWAAMVSLQVLRPYSWAVDHHFGNLLAISGTLALVCNYPHFMASYKLAYGRGARFVLRFWFQLLLVPAALLAVFAVGYRLYHDPETGTAFFAALGGALRGIGLDSRVGTAVTSGRELMGLAISFMYFTVGWHYSKQAYGCMMVYAKFDGYRLGPGQRRLLKASLFSIWAANFTYYNVGGSTESLHGVPYFRLGLPPVVYQLALGAFVLGLLVVLQRVVRERWQSERRLPSPAFLVPYVSFAIWWLPPLIQRDFYLLIVPFFHSLQYLPFVYKVEHERLRERHPASMHVRGTLIVLALVVAGFLAFELVPNTLDVRANTYASMQAWFFFVAALVFINTHHYFIDNVIWRFDQREVRDYLLR